MSSGQKLVSSRPNAPSSIDILQRLKRGIMQFIDDLIDIFPRESDLIIIRVFFEDQVPVVTIAEAMIVHVLPHRVTIASRNENFFLEENNIFGMIDTGKVLHFKKLWTSSLLDKDDRATIWTYFDTFITLVDAYKKSK
jgi:hypothetical protein